MIIGAHSIIYSRNPDADREAFAEIIKKHGGEILSKPGAPTLRFRAPDRTIVECVEPGRYQTVGAAPVATHA